MLSPEPLIDVMREAIALALMLSLPPLVAVWLTGLVAGFLQGVTDVRDPSLGFVPRLLVALLALAVMMPWLVEQLGQFTLALFSALPQTQLR